MGYRTAQNFPDAVLFGFLLGGVSGQRKQPHAGDEQDKPGEIHKQRKHFFFTAVHLIQAIIQILIKKRMINIVYSLNEFVFSAFILLNILFLLGIIEINKRKKYWISKYPVFFSFIA